MKRFAFIIFLCFISIGRMNAQYQGSDTYNLSGYWYGETEDCPYAWKCISYMTIKNQNIIDDPFEGIIPLKIVGNQISWERIRISYENWGEGLEEITYINTYIGTNVVVVQQARGFTQADMLIITRS